MHISAIREARNLEISTLKKSEKAFQPNPDKKDRKFPLLSAEKKELDKRFSTISQRVESFSPQDEGRDDYLSEENDENNDHVTGSQILFIIPFLRCYMCTGGLRNCPKFGGQNNLCRQPCIITELKLMVSFEPMDISRYHKCNGKLTN
ncbi:unnamed protein product [Prunus armeniaca]|uniref:Uncharacterized protein n=1 Tax=Prunus armeniaca TaxID=36596 RepID=A0A6J5W3C9_PRUAR|nr:unnamed protein product [Prunus armeniaca]